MNKSFRKIVVGALIFAGLAYGFYFLYHRQFNEKNLEQTTGTIPLGMNEGQSYATVFIEPYPDRSWFSQIHNMPHNELVKKVGDFADYYIKNPDFVKSVVNGPSNRSEIDDAILIAKNPKTISYLKKAKDLQENSPEKALKYLKKAKVLSKEELKTRETIDAAMIAIYYSLGRLDKAKEIYEGISPRHRNDFEMFGMLLSDLAIDDMGYITYSIENFLNSIANNKQSNGYRKEAWFFLGVDLKLLGDKTSNKKFYFIADRMLSILNENTRATWIDPDVQHIRIKIALGQYEIAERMLKKTFEKNKNNPNLPRDVLYESLAQIRENKKGK